MDTVPRITTLAAFFNDDDREKYRSVCGSGSVPQVTFISPTGERTVVAARPGQTVLEAAQANGVKLLGTCGGSMICATCHVRIAADYLSKLPPLTEEEESTLDLAFGVASNSRLGCQITLTDALDGVDICLVPNTLTSQ